MSKTAVKKKEGEETLGAKAAEIGRKSLEFFIGPIPRPTVLTPGERKELNRLRDEEAKAVKKTAVGHKPEKLKKHAKAAKKMEIYTAVAVAEPEPKAARKVRTVEEIAPAAEPEAQATQKQWIEAPAEPERQHRKRTEPERQHRKRRRTVVPDAAAAAPEVKVEEAPKHEAEQELKPEVKPAEEKPVPEPIAVIEPTPEKTPVYEKPAEKSDAEKKKEQKAEAYHAQLKLDARKAGGAGITEEIGLILEKTGMHTKGLASEMEKHAKLLKAGTYPLPCQGGFIRALSEKYLKPLKDADGFGKLAFAWNSDGSAAIGNVNFGASDISAIRKCGAELCKVSSDNVGYAMKADPGTNKVVMSVMTLHDLERVREAVRFIMKQYEKHLKPLEGGHLEHHVDWETGEILVGNVDFHASSIAPLKLACRLVGAQRRGVTYEMSEDEKNGVLKLELVRYSGQPKQEKPIDLGK